MNHFLRKVCSYVKKTEVFTFLSSRTLIWVRWTPPSLTSQLSKVVSKVSHQTIWPTYLPRIHRNDGEGQCAFPSGGLLHRPCHSVCRLQEQWHLHHGQLLFSMDITKGQKLQLCLLVIIEFMKRWLLGVRNVDAPLVQHNHSLLNPPKPEHCHIQETGYGKIFLH